jgi:hypothetical protein
MVQHVLWKNTSFAQMTQHVSCLDQFMEPHNTSFNDCTKLATQRVNIIAGSRESLLCLVDLESLVLHLFVCLFLFLVR